MESFCLSWNKKWASDALALLLLLLCALPTLFNLWRIGLPNEIDSGIHLSRIGALTYQLQQGVLYPRWTPELMLGHGYPVFSFYAPALYYLIAFIHLLGLPLYYAVLLVIGLLVLAAGVNMYLLAQDVFGQEAWWAALVAAVAYMVAPYFLSHNVIYRGAWPEAAAQAIFPWLLWRFRRLAEAQRPGDAVLPAALGLALLALMHNAGLLLFSPVLVGYTVVHWWQQGRSRHHLAWIGLTLLVALGVSAFFWVPLLGERQFLAETGFDIARTLLLPSGVWDWRNAVDPHLFYTVAKPVALGLVQTMLAGAGFVLARRRAEWWYLALVALVAGLGIGRWALPVWQQYDLLTAVQFPWRLLAVISLPLALFTGGLVQRLNHSRVQAGVSLGVMALLVITQQPNFASGDLFAARSTLLSLPIIAQHEVTEGAITGGEINTFVQEFRPRWAPRRLWLDQADANAVNSEPNSLQLTLQRANPLELVLQTMAESTATLRLHTFYFPGWQVQIDQGRILATYPSTNLGLLTVSVPAGQHEIRIHWQGTLLQRVAGLISLATLLLLAILQWRWGRARYRVWLLVAALLFGLAATFWRPAALPIHPPEQPVVWNQLRLLGARWEQGEPNALWVYPYWLVGDATPEDWPLRWQVRDQTGVIQAESASRIYFNTGDANHWPPGTLVDDAHRVPLPPGLPAGDYQLYLLTTEEGANDGTLLGSFTLAKSIADEAPPAHALNARFDPAMALVGYDAPPAAALPIMRPGERLQYTLYWRSTDWVEENYHSFLHLVDHAAQPLVQRDQLPGPLFRPPALWDRYTAQPDIFTLVIPRDTRSGLYWPHVGLYAFASQERVPVYEDDSATPGDHMQLAPVKVWNQPTASPQQPLNIQVGDFAHLVGYDWETPPTNLQPGARLTLRLYLQSDQATPVDYTRFVHMYQAELGMAAQSDSPPQQGANPTWAWQPGEIVVDRVTLPIAATAAPGRYQVVFGLYDRQAGGIRVPLRDASGTLLPDGMVVLAEVEIGE